MRLAKSPLDVVLRSLIAGSSENFLARGEFNQLAFEDECGVVGGAGGLLY